MIGRRELLGAAGAAAASLAVPRPGLRAQPLGSDSFLEPQRGDPGLPYEAVTIQPNKLDHLALARQTGRTAFDDWRREFPGAFVTTARRFVGNGRTATPERVAAFFGLFDTPPTQPDGRPAGFCAAGVGFVAAMTYCDLVGRSYNDANRLTVFRAVLPDVEHWYFYPTPSCWDLYRMAAGSRRWIEHPERDDGGFAHPGWIVVYDFGKGADHCGIVETADAGGLHTIEFNTVAEGGGDPAASGTVAARRRGYQHVKGFVVTTLPPRLPARG